MILFHGCKLGNSKYVNVTHDMFNSFVFYNINNKWQARGLSSKSRASSYSYNNNIAQWVVLYR